MVKRAQWRVWFSFMLFFSAFLLLSYHKEKCMVAFFLFKNHSLSLNSNSFKDVKYNHLLQEASKNLVNFSRENVQQKALNSSSFKDVKYNHLLQEASKNLVNFTRENVQKKAYCDFFVGKWVYDETYVLNSDEEECTFSSQDFKCSINGRKDSKFQHWRWQPRDCDLPRFNNSEFLEKMRNKRLVYVGDSLARNMWESLLCMLRSSMPKDQGRFTGSYGGKALAYIVPAFNCSLELSWAPFLVQQRVINNTGEILQLDVIDEKAEDWKNADFLVFNSGHWWTHPQPQNGNNYFEEQGRVHPHLEEHKAFKKAMTTWATWVDANIDPNRSQVFFRTYAPTHFNGKMWGKNVGGGCFNETSPIDNLDEEAIRTHQEHKRAEGIGNIIQESNTTKVKLLNITWMSMYRKDAHNAVYTGKADVNDKDYSKADCSHWCIPGLPDVWNHLLFAMFA